MTHTNKRWYALVAISLGMFMALLDIMIVNVALPTMQKQFAVKFTDLQWVLNAYTLTSASLLLFESKLGDLFGRKKIFMSALTIFTIGSLLNSLSTTLDMLVWSRVIQAVGGAGIMTLAMALVASIFQGKERGMAFAIVGSIIGLATSSGPLVGGILVQHFGWPSIFYINVPVGIVVLLLTWFNVSETPNYGAGKRIDFLGMLLTAAIMFSAIFGLIQKENHLHYAWTNPAVAGWLGAAVVLLVAFLLWERRVADPMMDLALFTKPHFVGSAIGSFLLGAGWFAFLVYLTNLIQNYMGYSAEHTGMLQLAASIWPLLLGPVVGTIGQRFDKRYLISGSFVLMAIGLLVMAHFITPNVTGFQLAIAMVLIGIGNAIINQTINDAGLSDVPHAEMGMASGIIRTFQQFGVTIGIVVLGLVQNHFYSQKLSDKWPKQAPADLQTGLTNAGAFSGHSITHNASLANLPGIHTIQNLVVKAFDHGLTSAIYTATGFILIGALITFILLRNKKAAI